MSLSRHSSASWNLTAFLLLAACAPTPQPLTDAELQTYPDARGMPADVQRFIVRHQGCEHWLGEPDWDAGRRRQIEQAVGELCPGIDAEGRRLRARYAADPEVIARLDQYEPLNQ